MSSDAKQLDNPLSQAAEECDEAIEGLKQGKSKLEDKLGPLGKEVIANKEAIDKLREAKVELEAKLTKKPDLWERLLFHHKILSTVVGVYLNTEAQGKKVADEAYYLSIGMAIQPRKGFMITNYTAKQAIGEFIETNGEGPEDPNKITQEQAQAYMRIGKKLMEEGIDNLLKNEEYQNHINELKGILNSEVSKAILKDLLSSFVPKEDIDKMSGVELYARTAAGLIGLGGRGVIVAGAAFDKYDAGDAGKLIKKSLGGLIV